MKPSIHIIGLDKALAAFPMIADEKKAQLGYEIIEQILACTENMQAGLLTVKAELGLDAKLEEDVV